VSFPDPQARIASLQRELAWAHLKIQSQAEELRQLRVKMLGPKSETLNDLQLNLLVDQEPGATLDEVEAESERAPLTTAPPRVRKPHPGRQRLPEHLERVEEIVPCTEQACRQCGAETTVIGYDESEQLDVVPARYFVRVIKREKRACRCCEKGAVTMAPLEPRIVEKGLASNSVVVDTVTAKYLDHLPLYRQAAILEREAGLEIGRATLDGWVMRIGEMLEPMVAAMRLDLLRSSYLQADETIVPVQMHDKRGADHQAYLWQYGRPGGETVFDFQLGRGRDGPRKFLGAWEGILQTDGYQAYEGVGGPNLVHVGCWAHARRKFIDAVKVNSEDVSAIQMVMRMDGLFLVDQDARQGNMTVEERLSARRQHVETWAEEIRQECVKLRETVLPKSALGKAVSYTLSQWPKLRRVFDYAEVELSNNLAENSMRPVALGRKNWLHVGSAKAGPRVAAILSIVESCRRLRVPVREYLLKTLPGLAGRKLSELTQLTPANWSAARN
jgi:transposase